VKHNLQHSALANQNLRMIKSTMPFHWHSPHHLTVYDNLTSYQNDDNDEINEVQWYTPVHVCQNKQSYKRVHFSESMKLPKTILHKTPEIEFKLSMNIIFKDGTGKSEHVVYKGVTACGLKHIIRHIDGSQSHVDQSHLSLINQIGLENIPQTPLDYCQEEGIGISQEQAQQSRALTPQQQELMS
jgi:hypothetical protein